MGLVRRSQDTLTHWGIPGQKWGVRRWQYPDGRFTEEGKERYFSKYGDFDKLNSEQNDKTVMNLAKAINKINKNVKHIEGEGYLSQNPWNASSYTREKLAKKYGFKISNKQMDAMENFMKNGLGDNATKKQIKQAKDIMAKYNIYDMDINALKDHDIFSGDD